MQWSFPFGVMTPASWMSLNATRYMHTYGVTNADFGRAVVQLRAYAAKNPEAHFYERPITLDDHQASRWIAEPAIRLFDCCQETDGAVAFVVTGRDRAADAPEPVVIAAAAGAGLFEEEVASDHYRADLSKMEGSVALAASAVRAVRHHPRRHRRGDGLRRVLADPAHAARSVSASAVSARRRTSSPTATSGPEDGCPATRTAG